MSRRVIIDGYNLLGVLGKPGAMNADENAREELLRVLALYRQQRGHAVTVVFDAWQRGIGAEHREFYAGLEVIYSRRGERADQVIQRLARDYGSHCAIVSSDREVSDCARRHGAFTIGSGEFAARLRAPRHPQGRSKHPADPKDRDDRDKDDRPFAGPGIPGKKKGNPKKLPKSLRRRNRQLKAF